MIAVCLFSFLLVGTLGYPTPGDDSPLESNDVVPQGDAASLIPEGEAEAPGLPAEQPEPEAEVALESAPAPQAELGPELAASKEEPSGAAAVPASRRRPTKGEDDDASESDAFPFGVSGAAGKGASAYNIFFPIQFSGARGRSGAGSGGYSAIANSFSTGRKGIATSHATSIGDPALAAEFFNFRKQGKADAA